VDRIVVSDSKTADEETIVRTLETSDTTVEFDVLHTEAELLSLADDVVALVVDAATPVTESVIEHLSALRVVGRAGIGVDNVDLDAAEANGVTVTNVPEYAVEEVATHALALLLAGVRGLSEYGNSTANREWDWTVGRPIQRLSTATIGIVAFGSIGRRFAELVQGTGAAVVAYDPYVDAVEMERRGVEPVDFDGLLEQADHLSIHAPLTAETRGLIDAAAFDRLPDYAVVVNTGRGGVVDESALLTALENEAIGRAGLDVLEHEPPDEPALLERNDVVVTPHTAWYSEASRRELARTVATDVAAVLDGVAPENRISAGERWG
jgi:D-3-phosphoglycerate dehydrogenase